MARLLLDSTVLIDARRGRPAAARLAALRRIGTEPWTFVISVDEIWRGLRPGEEAVARRARQGGTLHQADCLIAAAAAGVNARLATANVDDLHTTEINVQHWPIGR